MQFFPPPQSPYSPSAYDPPFTPRYSVPESFRRALSYEGQQHWLAGLCNELSMFAETCHQVWVVDTSTQYETVEEATSKLGTDVVFDNVTWPDMSDKSPISIQSVAPPERPDDLPIVKEGDVVAVRFNCEQDMTQKTCFFIGVLKEACRCVYPEKWKVHILCVVHDLSERMATAETEIASLKARVTTLESRMTDAEGRITALETRCTTIETRLDALETKVADHETRIVSLEGRMTNVENRVTSVEGRVTSIEGDVTNLKSRMTAVEGDVTNLKSRMTSVENRLTTVEGDVSTVKTQIQQLQQSAGTDSTARANADKANASIAAIVAKIFGGGTVNADGTITWPTTERIAIGNMNVYGGDSNQIRTRDGSVSSGSDNDVRVV